jgi:signal peptidase I
VAGSPDPAEAAGPAPPSTDAPEAGPQTARERRGRLRRPGGDEAPRGLVGAVREFVPLVLAALLLAVLIKSFLVQAFFIPSASMQPTLQPGDRILVCRICTVFSDVAYGDVIVFSDPHPGPHEQRGLVGGFLHWLGEGIGVARPEDEDFIKRVVALGGDTWEIRSGTLFVNGREVEEPYVASETDTRDFPPRVVPDGMLAVLGDNRLHSGDSRFAPPGGLGYIPEDKVIGEAFVIAWPLGRIGGLG